MVTGFKDWDKGVNINNQSLEQIINRPKYGGSIGASFSDQIINVGAATLLTVTGRGMIYGGFLLADDNTSGLTSSWRVTVDGVQIHYLAHSSHQLLGFPGVNMSLVYCAQYDIINHKFTMVLGYGFTFETSLVIAYQNLGSGTVDLSGFCYYALV